MIVLIPTSGTGSRLQRLTQFTNKSLVPVGDKLAICRIIDLYPEDTRFVITLGHCGSIVKEFITLAYPTRLFTFVDVDNYDGPGSSLGYSILRARSHLQCPFVFHCCDAILMAPPVCGGNVIYVSDVIDPSSYASVDVDEGSVTAVNMKGTLGKYSYVGVSHIENYIDFWSALESCEMTSSLSDVHALQKMVDNGVFFSWNLCEFYDTGNVGSYTKTKLAFPSSYDILEKNNESLCFFPEFVIKFCADVDINRKRVERARHITGAPTILRSSDHFIVMEFIKGTLLSEATEYGEVRRLLEWASTSLWVDPKTDPSFRETCVSFYRDKTMDRLKHLRVVDKPIVNGLTVGYLPALLDRVPFSDLSTETFYKFHGDFILDNIIKTGDQFALLDWRHEFGTEIQRGDMYYDLAKLRHNIILNHKNITNGLFKIHEGDKVVVDLKCNYILVRQLEEFDEFVVRKHLDLRKVKILMSLIWLNMAPLYTGKLQVFLFFFAKFNLFLQLRP
jgi:hypothetical protein